MKNPDDNRFECILTQKAPRPIEIWVDRETGVEYLFYQSGYASGLTPLLNREGKPVIDPRFGG